jgi:hypothetical protein
VFPADEVADLVSEDGEQVDAVLLVQVAGGGERAIVPRRGIEEPASGGGLGAEVDGVA